MALGCAIVAPATPNLCEILVDNQNALLFESENPDSFSQVLKRVCSDPTLRERIGHGAARTIIDRGLTWENNAQRVVTLFEILGVGTDAVRKTGAS